MKVFWDTNLFIYLWERKNFQAEMSRLTKWMEEGSHSLITSSLTVGEILVQPLKLGRVDLHLQYLNLFQQLEIISFGIQEADCFASLRVRYPFLRAPDAIQLSCAASSSCDLFLTNDRRLSQVKVVGVARVCSLDGFLNND